MYLWMAFGSSVWGGEVEIVSGLMATDVNQDGYREVLGVAVGSLEDQEGWQGFLRYTKGRGLERIRLLVWDKSLDLLEALHEYYPDARWQSCKVHFYRKVQRVSHQGKIRDVSPMLKAIHAKEDPESARRKVEEVASKLRDLRLNRVARIAAEGCEETLTYNDFPSAHWRNLCANNPPERLNREICHGTRVVGSFPDGHAALMLVSVRLRYMAGQI